MRMTFAEKALLSAKPKPFHKPVLYFISIIFVLVVACIYIVLFAYRMGAGSVPPPTSHLDKPPLTLNINGQRWAAYPSDFKGKVDGLTECKRRIIWYDFSGATWSYSREIMWHEIGHAIRCASPESELYVPNAEQGISKEHRMVYEMGMGISAFVHDNPDFMKWAEDWKDK